MDKFRETFYYRLLRNMADQDKENLEELMTELKTVAEEAASAEVKAREKGDEKAEEQAKKLFDLLRRHTASLGHNGYRGLI